MLKIHRLLMEATQLRRFIPRFMRARRLRDLVVVLDEKLCLN
ncbi:unnamed protein product [Brassica oleracea var. botrytis]